MVNIAQLWKWHPRSGWRGRFRERFWSARRKPLLTRLLLGQVGTVYHRDSMCSIFATSRCLRSAPLTLGSHFQLDHAFSREQKRNKFIRSICLWMNWTRVPPDRAFRADIRHIMPTTWKRYADNAQISFLVVGAAPAGGKQLAPVSLHRSKNTVLQVCLLGNEKPQQA